MACWGISLFNCPLRMRPTGDAILQLANTSNLNTVRLGAFSTTAYFFVPHHLVELVR
jgi:hypothetical protein